MLLGIPMWQPATLEMAVQHYEGISGTFPDFPLMVYANSRAFRFDLPIEFWKQIAQKAPTVMACKGGSPKTIKELIEVTNHRVTASTSYLMTAAPWRLPRSLLRRPPPAGCRPWGLSRG